MARKADSSFLRRSNFNQKHGTTAMRVRGPGRSRIVFAMTLFVLVYGAIAGRLILLGLQDGDPAQRFLAAQSTVAQARPDIVDRNGEILATDIKSAALYAEPRKIPDTDEVFDGLISVLPELDTPAIKKRLESNALFTWLKREITVEQRQAIHALGLPGVGFRESNKRFYPGGQTVSHILGTVNVDNQGLSGMEKYVDQAWLKDLQDLGFTQDRNMEPVKLSVDLRVQHAVRDELRRSMEYYKAKAAMGVVLKADTGEVIAMTSLPDFDPNNRQQALEKARMNRVTGGVFELGSIFKGLTIAMALDSGKVKLEDGFDATKPIRVAGQKIDDFHGKRRVLSVPEVFIYSSNIGTIKVMQRAGIEAQKEFLSKVGLTEKMNTEMPGVARPLLPPKWNELAAMTISFGHGVGVTPLQMAVAGATLVNGGKYLEPTFLPRSEEEADKLAKQVLKPETSEILRYLNRENVLRGSGRRAAVPGYDVGGKTGTAQKVVNGRYAEGVYLNSFMSAFPMSNPEYLVLIVLDEPQKVEGQRYSTAGWNAVPTTASVIRRIAPMLGVVPDFADDAETIPVSYQNRN
ncbi:cell division protein FtsI (penicillin-binding protein 3) [Pseudovibrio denitrificans]|uniref:Cell division protein FtsI (Penicillin-binding protein 3) n=1 Tax=Pseudovibrio denitrificans TaxID=258256 RepID=A0A1I6ZG90_9HYPH|nr:MULTISPECIES: penicillin-binding protein 2 [Pseudovibrio]EEA95970.1 penicillin-binding protein, transpeptidase [Pseudovibrio sp. JE062]SFT61708.1 cell division protein FtsI (penicillin-binding protein 3) [Pseudovibrio denitrificans]